MFSASPDSGSGEPGRFWTRLSRRSWIGLAIVALVVVTLILFKFVHDADVVDFDVRGIDGVLRVTLGRLTFTFDGVPFPCPDSTGGSLRVGGAGSEEFEMGTTKNRRSCVNDHITLRESYSDGECRLSVNEFSLKLLERGTVLVCQGERFDVA